MQNIKETLSELLSNSLESIKKSFSSFLKHSKEYKKEMLEKDFEVYNLYYMMLNELNNNNKEIIEGLEYENELKDIYWYKDYILRHYMHKLHKINYHDETFLAREILKKESEAYKELIDDVQKEIKRCCDELEKLKEEMCDENKTKEKNSNVKMSTDSSGSNFYIETEDSGV